MKPTAPRRYAMPTVLPSLRSVFAGLLWLAASAPPILILVDLGSPLAALELADHVGVVLRFSVLALAGLAALGLLLYPPFLPWTRLAWHHLKRRLTTDPGPLLEARSRLGNLETVTDHLIAGRILRDQGQVPASLLHFARAVELEPGFLAAHHELGITYMRLGKLLEAAEQLALVVRQDEQHAFGAALLNLGIALERAGADAPAIEALERHQTLFGENRTNLYHRARAKARLGQRELAIELLGRAARAPEPGTRITLEDGLVRAQARVALLRGGRL